MVHNLILNNQNQNLHKNPNKYNNENIYIIENFKETDFAVTDLSHSKAIIEIEGQDTKEVEEFLY